MDTEYGNKAKTISVGIVCILIPLAVGMISAILSGDQMKSFGELNQPPLSPPAWLFPVAWTILYILMGIALLLILRANHRLKAGAIGLFASQLILNFLWSPVFFMRRDYVTAMIILVLMLALTIILTVMARQINRAAAILLVPYIAWMAFAAYLNAGVGLLNN